ncbi:Hypothetical protein LUCI_0116 [Lucifera butyrica]|uniref:Cyclophilin-like domain-containing protein n=1 Tax=Lucifera butyrica TaxID=1351585 RepID=A0A498R2B7_9FIRM|nr:cyclophilin-like fold protein [Lucifera butyrica]VBB04910.1 Hypothetical protein LUCI_0116 [Lucifera butyrica]
MKRLLTVFLALTVFCIMVAGCGMEAAKSTAGAESSGSVQSASGKVQTTSSDDVRPFQTTKIRLIFDGGDAVAELYDNPTSRDLVSMLPLTLSSRTSTLQRRLVIRHVAFLRKGHRRDLNRQRAT